MTRIEREELLRRYMHGELNLEQEHEFFIQVALDKELRHELKAQQTIDRAFQKDRVVNTSAYAPIQGKVAAMLAAAETSDMPRGSVGEKRGLSLLRSGKWIALGAAVVGVSAAWFGLGTEDVPVQSNLPIQETEMTPDVQGEFLPGTMRSDVPQELRSDNETEGVPLSSESQSPQEVMATESVQQGRPSSVPVADNAISADSSTSQGVMPVSSTALSSETEKSADPDREDSINVGANILWNLGPEQP